MKETNFLSKKFLLSVFQVFRKNGGSCLEVDMDEMEGGGVVGLFFEKRRYFIELQYNELIFLENIVLQFQSSGRNF
ncbi:hypothetical protein LBBP_01585 [Leptospira borgpetersenii serovar Ballum]|uniref:Uncharacterized protein n=4 Tax=Leptospira borgpetersenii TaxID=174 RepID=A0A0S2IQG3_LEPBO|nr:hypothetical protein LBBP_01585 [Leptospira borgpetersenii serovar Ballum]